MEHNYATLVEDLLKAVKIVAEAEVQKIAFDTTKVCTIIDDTDRDNGKYIVSDGTIKFDAYSESGKYRKNDIVRVTIPNNDYSQKKYIEGKSVTNNELEPIAYVSPSDSSVDTTNNMIQDGGVTYGIAANDDVMEKCIWAVDFADEKYADLKKQDLYDIVLFKAEFQCLLSNQNVRTGHYGLRLDFYLTTPGDKEFVHKQIYLDSASMFGNPFAFSIFTLQELKIDISSWSDIRTIGLYLYQKNDFYNYQGNKIAPTKIGGKAIDNIFVKNIYLGLGNDLVKIEDNSVQIVTNDSLTYNKDIYQKDISLLWYNKSQDNKYLGYSDGICDPTYDEIEYLEKSKNYNRKNIHRGKAVPQNDLGLTLAADREDIISLLDESYDLIGRDLNNQLNIFSQKLNIDSLPYEDIKVGELANNLDNAKNLIVQYYDKNLLTVYEKFEQGKNGTLSSLNQNETKTVIANVIDKITVLQNLLNDFNKEQYISFLSIIDFYRPQIIITINKVQENLNKVQNFLSKVEDNFNEFYKANYSYEPMAVQDFAEYANKYCIYWYRYRKGYSNPNEIFLESEWEKLDLINYGLPIGIKNEFLPVRPEEKDNLLKISLDPELSQEKYRAVLFYNHDMFLSNVLEFTNESETFDNISPIITDAIHLEHGTNSQDLFQAYGASNYLINSADSYRPREIILRLDSKKLKKEDLIGAWVYWYIPNNATMLKYKTEDFDGYITDINAEQKSIYHQDGYISFYKKIEEADLKDDLKMKYYIAGYYVPTFSRNIIQCKIIKGDYVFPADMIINFSTFGTSGTDYTLVVLPTGYQQAVLKDNPLELEVLLYDYNNKRIEPQGLNVKWWQDNNNYFGLKLNENENKITITYLENNHPGILEVTATISKEKNVTLTTLYPVAYSSGDYYIEGASQVVYDSTGGNPVYYKDPYKIYSKNTFKEITENISWDITKQIENDSLASNFLPKLQNNKLIPCVFYLGNVNVIPIVTCLEKEQEILWEQPIIIMQNRYASNMLNSWDGSLKIDEESGSIMSTMVGAGSKDSKNTFSGVLMGDVRQASEESGSGFGLYGYHEGAQSFAFMNDGTGFIGKSGHGRIYFDGNKSQIRSAAWSQTESAAGLCIDLDDGWIDIKGAKKNEDGSYSVDGTQSHVRIDVKDPYFQIKSVNGNELIHIGSNEYYMQTDNFSEKEKLGLRFDLKNGNLIGYNFKLQAGTAPNQITIDSQGNYPLAIGNNFSVTWSGMVSMSNANISGTIAASGGSIGKWLITTEGNLQSTNESVILNGTDGSITGANNNFIVDKNGYMTAEKGIFKNCTVSNSLILTGEEDAIIFGDTNATYRTYLRPYRWGVDDIYSYGIECQGDFDVTGYLAVGGSLEVQSKLYCSGEARFGTDLKPMTAIDIYGNLRMRGSQLYFGDNNRFYLKALESTNINEADTLTLNNAYFLSTGIQCQFLYANTITAYNQGSIEFKSPITGTTISNIQTRLEALENAGGSTGITEEDDPHFRDWRTNTYASDLITLSNAIGQLQQDVTVLQNIIKG